MIFICNYNLSAIQSASNAIPAPKIMFLLKKQTNNPTSEELLIVILLGAAVTS